MYQLHTKSLCSKNKTNKTRISHKNITQRVFTANQCNFYCCFSDTNSAMFDFTLASATPISFSQQSPFLLLVLTSTNLEKDHSQRYVVTNGASISTAFLAVRGYGTIWWHQNVESIFVLKNSSWSGLCWSSMILSRYSSLTSAVATLNVNGCLTHDGYDSLVGKYPSRDFASSSKCMATACFSSPGIGMSPIPDTSSILLTQSSSRGKLQSYHALFAVSIKIAFFWTPSGFLPLRWCQLHRPASVDWDDWEHRKYVRQHEN